MASGVPVDRQVVKIVLPGEEDPVTFVNRGGLELLWDEGGIRQHVRKFREQKPNRCIEGGVSLPTLYLHFLDARFLPRDDGEFDPTLRGGNDNAEMLIVLPKDPVDLASVGDASLQQAVATVLNYLKMHGQAPVSALSSDKPGTLRACACPERLYFSLKTAQPKANISLDKKAFGIPFDAELYLFVQNHSSVADMDNEDRAAFELCIDVFGHSGCEELRSFSVFLKIFYEGGFGYNKKIDLESGRAYIPKNVGIACMNVIPAFDGQAGISTGQPYHADPEFVDFAGTVPVTIRSISSMSQLHQRYGLCFTRCIHVWAGPNFARDGVLDFCCLTPHGGFYYVPATPKQLHNLGGLVYAFGDARHDSNAEMTDADKWNY